MVSDNSRSWSVLGQNTDMFTDGSRTRIVCGHGQAAVSVADRTLQDAFQPFREHCVGNCVDDLPDAVRSVNRTPTWTLRVRQTNCFADSSGNCPDASRLLRQLLCGHLSALHEMLPGNCSDTARKLPSHCSCDLPDIPWTRTGRGLVVDWSWTGCGGGHSAGHSPASARTLSVRCLDAGRMIPGYCPDSSPDAARMIQRTIRRTSYRMLRGHCATCHLTFM